MLSIIIPAYNEEKCIRPAYTAISSLLKENNIEAELIYVDDGSQDNTYQSITELSLQEENIVGYIAIASQEKYSEVNEQQYLWLWKGLSVDVHGMVA